MWSTTLRGIAGHKRRFVSTCVAVVLGVAFLTGTLVLGDTIRGGFDRMFATANEGTAVVVRSSTKIGSADTGQRGVVDPATLATVRSVPGVAVAEAVVDGPAQIVAADGTTIGGNGPPTLGSSWIDDPRLEPYRVVEGRAPTASVDAGAPVEVVIDKASAETAGLTVGDTTTVLVPERVPVVVVGLVGFGDADSMAGVTFTGFAAQDAARLLAGGRPGVTEIRVAAEPGIGQDELSARIATVLPPATEAVTGTAVAAEQLQAIEDDFLGVMQTMLVIFAGVALLVASFSIHNTFSIVAAQRSRESALLRAIGATRGQVLGSVVLEALLVGVLATAVGVGAGIGLAAGLRALIEGTDAGLPAGVLVIGAASVVVPVVIGLGVTLVAAVGPALRSSRVSPLAALRATAVEAARVGRARLVAGAVAAVGGTALIVVGATSGALGQVGLGSLAIAVAFVLLGPVLARPAGRLLGAPARLVRGVTGQLAQENAVRNPRRTAGTATALVIGIGVVAVFTVFGSSLRTSVDREVSGSFGDTDLVVRSTSFAGSGLPASFVHQIGEVDGVGAVSPLSFADVDLDGTAETATITDPAQLDRVSDLKLVEGDIGGLDATSIAVSKAYADDHGWTAGSTVDVAFADGTTVPATVGATYRAKGALGDLIVPTALWEAHATRPLGAGVVLVGLADGADLDRTEAAITALARDAGSPTVETRQEYVDGVAQQVNQLLTVVYVLLAVAVVIALLGIANTLTLSIHERTRELGMLRALGQTRRQLRSMIRWESAVVATFGVLAGLGLGTLIGWGLVKAGGDAIDISTFTVPVGQFVVIALVGAAAGVVAAWRPARRASRLRVLDAIAGD